MTTWPNETVEPTEHQQDRPSRGRIECPACEKLFLLSAVVVDQIKTVPTRYGSDVYPVDIGRCRLFCDHCSKLYQWRAEIFDGWPTRNIYGPRQIITDRQQIRALLAAHPEAAGVNQS